MTHDNLPSGEQSRTVTGAIIDGRDGKATEVSFQHLQDVYNALTGRTEEVDKRYDKPFQIEFEDIRQLNRKIEQTLEQYHVSSAK